MPEICTTILLSYFFTNLNAIKKDTKNLVNFLLYFGNLHQILNNLENQDGPHSSCFFEITDCERFGQLDKCLKRPVSEQNWVVNLVKGVKDGFNLHGSTFIIFFHHSQGNWVGKCLS